MGDCFDVGRCNGNTVGSDLVNDECECQSLCSSDNNCEFFTFDSSNSICSLTGNCSSVGECSTCLHGPPECPTDVCVDCFEQGTCQGNVVSSVIAASLSDCVDTCQNTT